MKKISLVLATASALALGSLLSPQPARAADPVTVVLVAGAVGWVWCRITYGAPRVTPFCAVPDAWAAAVYGPPRR